MKRSISLAALSAVLGLCACSKPTEVPLPASQVLLVPVPGPAGAMGASGPAGVDGAKGETGRTGDAATLIVLPPAASAASQ
jgi:hypothetical protein